jgi:hypothetical protein
MTSAVETLFRLLSNRQPGTQNAGPRRANQEPETSDLVLHPSNQEPETSNQELLGVDWNAVLNTAAHNGLEPLLFKRLKENGTRPWVPPDTWDRLRLAYFESARKNIHLYRELRPVLSRLRDSGIPVIVLKGAFLAEVVYRDVALRPMCDVDLMVPKAEQPKAQAVLLDMGGIQQEPAGNELFWKEHHHPPPTIIHGISIELHWAIADPAEAIWIDPAGFWNRAQPATIAGVEVLGLSVEDLLLNVCIHHCCVHHLKGLRSFCDIAETIRLYRGKLDWHRVTDLSHEWHAARYVALTLDLTRRLLGTDVTDDVFERLVPGGIDEHVLHRARQFVLADTGYTPWSSISGLLGARTLADKARLLWQRVFISREEMARVYPASRGSRFLGRYYALRLRDAIRDRGATAMKLARSSEYTQEESENGTVANWLKSR